MTYYINGWREGRGYFYRAGRFTADEIDRLERGETVEKNGNTFWITNE